MHNCLEVGDSSREAFLTGFLKVAWKVGHLLCGEYGLEQKLLYILDNRQWEWRQREATLLLTWVNAVVPGFLFDSHWRLESMPWGAWNAWDPVIIQGVMVLLLESLRRMGGNRGNRLRHLPVIDRAIVPRKPWLRIWVARFRHLSLKPWWKEKDEEVINTDPKFLMFLPRMELMCTWSHLGAFNLDSQSIFQ